jgi:hypothetical protein
MKIDLELEQSEFNTIIAALSHWHQVVARAELKDDWSVVEQYDEVLFDGMDQECPDYLSSDEIEYLIEFINCE